MEPEQKPAAEPQQGRRIPNTDMQAEDTGTTESGNQDADRGTAAESAMKQESKTESESGERR